MDLEYFSKHTLIRSLPINVEILMRHPIGISDSYYKPTETILCNFPFFWFLGVPN
ncbi:hypothetical protein BH23THE1_BH23THE1_33480 [soil metagenome]